MVEAPLLTIPERLGCRGRGPDPLLPGPASVLLNKEGVSGGSEQRTTCWAGRGSTGSEVAEAAHFAKSLTVSCTIIITIKLE